MDKVKKNAEILNELVRLYPEETMGAIINVLDMPVIDRNNAVWYAIDKGFIKDTKDLSQPMQSLVSLKLDTKELEATKQSIMYTLHRLSIAKQDVAEHTLNQWLTGYPTHWVAIALRQMIESGDITSYTLVDEVKHKKSITENPYLFYTLPQNADKKWGVKQFKDAKKIRVKDDDAGITRH